MIDGEIESSEYLLEMLCTLHYISYTLYNWGTNMVCGHKISNNY